MNTPPTSRVASFGQTEINWDNLAIGLSNLPEDLIEEILVRVSHEKSLMALCLSSDIFAKIIRRDRFQKNYHLRKSKGTRNQNFLLASRVHAASSWVFRASTFITTTEPKSSWNTEKKDHPRASNGSDDRNKSIAYGIDQSIDFSSGASIEEGSTSKKGNSLMRNERVSKDGLMSNKSIADVLGRSIGFSPAGSIDEWASTSKKGGVMRKNSGYERLGDSGISSADSLDLGLNVIRAKGLIQSDSVSLVSCTSKISWDKSMNYSNGLLCSGSSRDCFVLNPSNGMSKSCPRFSVDLDTRTFIGFNTQTCQFMLLGMSRGINDTDHYGNHKVLTVKGKHDCWIWKHVECVIPHIPCTRSVSISGTIFYGASLSRNQISLISFDLNMKTFASVPIPEPGIHGMFTWETCPFQIGDSVGISFSDLMGRHRVWMLKDDVWSLTVLETPASILPLSSHLSHACFEGLTKAGHKVFTITGKGNKWLVYCDTSNEIQCTAVEGASTETKVFFFDHTDNILFI